MPFPIMAPGEAGTPPSGDEMLRRCFTMPWLMALVVAACGEVAPGIQDVPEAGGEAPDVPRLADATILVPPEDPGPLDPAPGDPGAPPPDGDAMPDAGGPGFDTGGSRDLQEPDPAVVAPDPGPQADAGTGDAFGNGELPIAPPCGPEQRPCDPTQVCVWDTDGTSHCAPMAECSGRGAMDLDQLLRWFLQGDERELAFKVRGQPWVGQATCGGPPCDGACCRSCWAFLFLGDQEIALPLMGQGVAISCQGNECNWMDHCAPMTPGQCYWIWGRADRLGMDFRLLVEGFCPADAALESD